MFPPTFLSFGHISSGDWKRDLAGRLTGWPNLLKRMQAAAILRAVEPRQGEKILDFGCGGWGAFTIEMARRGAEATGLDVVPLHSGPITIGAGRADFVTYSGELPLPFADETFDQVLITEVVIVLPDPQVTINELHRALKKGGRLIMMNTLGRLGIAEAYRRDGTVLRLVRRLIGGVPEDYGSYCEKFLASDRLRKTRWYTIDELQAFCVSAGLEDVKVSYPFRGLGYAVYYWCQFLNVVRGRSLSLRFGILRYCMLGLLNRLVPVKNSSDVVITGIKC